MLLTRTDDPRDNLEKMTRDELWYYAKENGVADKFPDGHNTLVSDYTSDSRPNMVSILRSLGFKGKDMSGRTIGGPPLRTDPIVHKPLEVMDMTIQQLRAEGVKRGLKVERTDNKDILREKLSGQNAA